MPEDRRGLRFLLDAGAEIAPEDLNAAVAARATELSLRGCYFKLASPIPVETRVLVKIFHDGQYFEAKSNVVHVQPASGMGVAFREIKPHCKSSLQKWIFSALHDHNTEEASAW
jgi:c-di-GMP-binding flagellar brake protein YcgR